MYRYCVDTCIGSCLPIFFSPLLLVLTVWHEEYLRVLGCSPVETTAPDFQKSWQQIKHEAALSSENLRVRPTGRQQGCVSLEESGSAYMYLNLKLILSYFVWIQKVSESFQLTFSRFNLNPVTLESHSLAVLWDRFVIKHSSKPKHNNFRSERKKAFCLPDTTAIKNFSEFGCFVS